MYTLIFKLNVFIGTFSTICVALDDSRNAQITNYQFDNIGSGEYHWGFESSDGISREEEGHFPNPDTNHVGALVKGSYSYTGDDGVVYSVRYTADDNGFHPEGDHIKVPPFVPWLHHQHHEEDDGVNSNPTAGPPQNDVPSTSPLYLPSTPAPVPQRQEPVDDNNNIYQNSIFRQTQPNPELFVRDNTNRRQHVTTTLKPPRSTIPRRFFTTTQRPVQILQGESSTVQPLSDIDIPIGNSLLTLIPTVRRNNIQEINNLKK